MTSPGQEPTNQLPIAHENGRRSLTDTALTDTAPLGAGSASTAGPSQPVSVSPVTAAATPSARHDRPLNPEQQVHQGQASQPDVAQRDMAAAAATTAASPPPPEDRVHAEGRASPIRAWKRRHMLLLLPALILSVVGLGLSGNAAARGLFHLSGADAILAIPVPIYVLTIVFAVAEMAVRVVRKFKAGFHPAVHVGVWLICWLIYAGLVAAFAIVVRWVGEDDEDDDDDADRNSLNKRQFLAQFVFIILLLLNTFILFIMSCIDTSAYNAAKATPPATDDNNNALDPNHHEDRSWRLTKLIFNILVVVFGVVGFAIGISMVRFQDRYFSNDIIFPACACALLIPILWAVADLCFALTGVRRRFLQGVHPGAHVGMWLVSWLILAVVGGLLTTYAVYSIEECHDYREQDLRRSFAVDGHTLPTAVPVEVYHARQVGGGGGGGGGATLTANLLATPTTNPDGMNPVTMRPTSSQILSSLPTTTTTPFGSDPDDQDPYNDLYYPYHPSSSSSSSSSRPTSSAYGSGSYNSDPSDYPRGSYYDGGYDRDRYVLCSRAGVDGLMITTCVFMWIVFVFAFVLFVAGCSDTYLRNHLRDPVTVVYVPVGQPVQYAYPPPQPVYSGVPVRGGEKQAMAQNLPFHHQHQHQQTPPAQENVIEYYGSSN